MSDNKLPVEIVLSPEWWYAHEGIIFDRDYFFHPAKRVEVEQKMEEVLYERWGKYGLGGNKNDPRPEVGAVHLASGFLLPEMMGCKVIYSENHPPRVIPANREGLFLNAEEPFKSTAFKDFTLLMDKLKKKYGYLTGDVNWGGILNLALDLRGADIFSDILMDPHLVRENFKMLSGVISKFVSVVQSETGTSSISVNRSVRYFSKPVFLHSECSHTMISADDYENILLEYDINWSNQKRPFGIHYCGKDPHRFAGSFANIPHLDFLDLGWGGDVKILRKKLPNTFFNLRLSPVEIRTQDTNEIRETILRLVNDSGNPYLTGVCCINIDDSVADKKIDIIFETVREIRERTAD
jgi:hypothetical protein